MEDGTKGDNNGGEETLPMTHVGSPSYQQEVRSPWALRSNRSVYSSTRSWVNYYCLTTETALIVLAILFCGLLITDVGLRVSHISNHLLKRWVPRQDILHDNNHLNTNWSQSLKYNYDVGNYGLQGLAFHSQHNALYEVHTLGVRVLHLDFDGSGKIRVLPTNNLNSSRVWESSEFPPLLNNQVVAHIGGVDLSYSAERGTELWLATHSEGVDGVGGLFAVDPQTLNIKGSERSVLTDYNLDWVAHSEGVLYFGEFFNVKKVHRVRLDTLQTIEDLDLELPPYLQEEGINYVQSAAFDADGQLVLLGDDYQCTVYFLDVTTGQLDHSQGLLLGSETDGIAFVGSKRMLVGYNRQHSHEQVMHMDDMVSIMELVLQ